MAKVDTALKARGLGKTSRRDAWYAQPLVTFLILSGFLVYATWAAFQGKDYHVYNYLSPFYSPEIFGDSPHRILGPKPGWWPSFLPFSPALLILPFPALFRFTCYYYRGAYYKAFWADPPACAVGEPKRKRFIGENGFPMIVQNVHRYFMYFALAFLLFLWHDAFKGFWFPATDAFTYSPKGLRPVPDVPFQFGIGVGSLVLLFNTCMLTCYTLSCHSFRHLIGGKLDCLSRQKTRFKCYTCVSAMNGRHMLFAWISLFGVMFADLYVRLVASGVWRDFRFF